MPDTRDFLTEILEIERSHHIFQITESDESSKALTCTPTLELPNPLIPSTPTTKVPIHHIPLTSPHSTVKQAATTPSQQPTGLSMRVPSDTFATPPNTSEFAQEANKEHLDETEKTTIERAKTLKRTLFPAEPQEHKKNKAD
ncbi:hypothetical protein Tco_0317323 [Tanacetum coccineum]